ncbi:MAG TPA: DUF4956 domain-containing protein [Bacillota bacterium]|nr:DUF4956 domain-containing protein [Bacillota bacterium]HPP84469.1 DUF4956 domain-containing protein [Bacillota bacterium]
MTFKDILKNFNDETFKQYFNWLTISETLIVLVVALVMGLLICFIYTKFFRGVVYSRTFSITLIGMCVMTSMVTLAISSNIVISLGMVGALSIVRYRTAIKEPLDLLYLFWSITTGITVGAKMYVLSVIAAVIMILIILLFSRRSITGRVYIMVVHYVGDLAGDMIRKALGSAKYRIKSKTVRKDASEMAIEIFAKGDSMAFVEKIRAIDNVLDVTIIQYDGEYHG